MWRVRIVTASALPWRLAAPSFVVPGTVAENCAHLQGRVDEIGLCLFEAQACLEYSDTDLPAWLASLQGRHGPMRFHAHLPLDLPWEADQGRQAVDICVALARMTAFLQPHIFVLHPPPDVGLLEIFIQGWREAGLETTKLCLENTRDNDLALVMPLAYAADCGLCLDFGHAVAYGQNWLLQSTEALERVRLLHVYAPGGQHEGRHRHRPLTELTAGQASQLDALLKRTLSGPTRSLLVEVFHWPHWENSSRVLEQWRPKGW